MPTTLMALPAMFAALVSVSVASTAGANGDTTVYRCTQASGAVLYADYPCKGGVIVEIRPGDADPRATERLARVRSELDRAAAQRKADEEIAAYGREQLNQWRREAEAAQIPPASTYARDFEYGPGYGYSAPLVKGRTHRRNRHPRAEHHRSIPESRVPAVIRRP